MLAKSEQKKLIETYIKTQMYDKYENIGLAGGDIANKISGPHKPYGNHDCKEVHQSLAKSYSLLKNLGLSSLPYSFIKSEDLPNGWEEDNDISPKLSQVLYEIAMYEDSMRGQEILNLFAGPACIC